MTLRALLLMMAVWLVGAGHGAQAQDVSPLAQRVAQERAEIPAGDLDARFNLAMWTYRQYSPASRNIEALQLARQQLQELVDRTPPHPHAATIMQVVDWSIEEAQRALRPDYLGIAFTIVGGLGLFLLGMRYMSEGVQAVSGHTLRRMISAVTDNRLMAVGIGATVTSMIQSSSITTVIVVGLVNSGVMLLHQSIGVIMGANIGTTITGWVLVLPIAQYGLPIIGVAAFFHLFSKGDRPRFIALTALGLGLVFFGLTLMKDGFAPMREVDTFRDALAWFDATTYFGVFKCIAVGCIVTFIVQSSTATLGLTIGLAATGVIPFHTAAALVLGENVGTTITAWLASLGATTDARRAAWSHVLFNLIGAAWVSIIFPWFVPAVAWFVRLFEMGDPLTITPATASSPAHCAAVITAGIAATHTLFNLANLLLFLPFIRSFARLLKWIIPETAVVTPATLTHLDIRLVESPMIAIAQSRSEILRMGDGVLEMLDWTADLLRLDHIDESIVQRVFQREQLMDDIEQSIINFMTELLTGTVPHDVAEEGREQLRIADELESVSDYIASVVKQHLRLRKTGLRLTPTEHERRMDLHHLVRDYVEFVVEALRRADRSALDRAHRDGDRITQRFKELREIHLQKLTEDKINPTLSMSYMTMLSDYRRIKDHAENIIEALAGHK